MRNYIISLGGLRCSTKCILSSILAFVNMSGQIIFAKPASSFVEFRYAGKFNCRQPRRLRAVITLQSGIGKYAKLAN